MQLFNVHSTTYIVGLNLTTSHLVVFKNHKLNVTSAAVTTGELHNLLWQLYILKLCKQQLNFKQNYSK
jgi:hypothetical protein